MADLNRSDIKDIELNVVNSTPDIQEQEDTIPNMQSIHDKENFFSDNRFCRSWIIAYYMLSRDKPSTQAKEIIERKNLWNKIGEELVRYIAGFDIEIDEEVVEDLAKDNTNSSVSAQ